MRRALAVLAVVALPLGAAAAPPAHLVRAASERFERANRLYHEGRYTEALHLYQAAYDILPSPDILFNLGLAREKTFDYEGCAAAMQQFLKQPGSAEAEQRARQRLEQCRARALIPVKVSSFPPSAAVYVGEGRARTLRGRTPARLDLAPGTYELTVELPGYRGQRQKVTADIGTRPEVDFTLEKLSSLRVEADVPEAAVRVNDGVAETAPLVREVPAGLYRVQVSRSGYRAITRELRIEAGQQVSLMLALSRQPRTLALTSSAPAVVRIDGSVVGHTPLTHFLPGGSHHLEVAAPGQVPSAGTFVMRDDQDVSLRVEMRRRPSRWHLVVAGGLLGTAVACGIAATTYGALALADEHRYKTGVPTRALRDEGRSHARMADALWIGAASVAAVAVAYYLLTRARPSRLVVER